MYRVYSEEAYLAGADRLDEWPASPSRDSPGERRLRRLAGAAALTGALGTVGGAIVVAGVGVRSADRRVAASGTPRTAVAHAGQTGRPEAIRRMPVNRRHGLIASTGRGAIAGGDRPTLAPGARECGTLSLIAADLGERADGAG